MGGWVVLIELGKESEKRWGRVDVSDPVDFYISFLEDGSGKKQ